MKIFIAGHVTIDKLYFDDQTVESIGGPPAYAGLTARSMGLSVTLATKFGYDFSDEYKIWLSRNQIDFGKDPLSHSHRTTRFDSIIRGGARSLKCVSRCEDVTLEEADMKDCDAILVSPVVGEIRLGDVARISRSAFRFTDPQGFLRRFDADGLCSLAPNDKFRPWEFSDFVKMDVEEAATLTGGYSGVNALRWLAKQGLAHAILTEANRGALLLVQGKLYRLPGRSVDVVDSTGAGDIFAGAFIASFIKDGDPIWAACIGLASSSLHLDRKGLAKLPQAGEAQRIAVTIREWVKRLEDV